MTTLGRTCAECNRRPAIRVDDLCADCGETADLDARGRRVFLDENPRYGPGNPDWERDFQKTVEEL